MLLCYPSGHYGNRQNKQHKLLCKPRPPVIRSREDSDTLPSMCHLISILFDLMAPDDQVWRETERMRGGDTGQGRRGMGVRWLWAMYNAHHMTLTLQGPPSPPPSPFYNIQSWKYAYKAPLPPSPLFAGDTLFELRSSLQLAEVEREGVRPVHITANNYRVASGPTHRDFPPTSPHLSNCLIWEVC